MSSALALCEDCGMVGTLCGCNEPADLVIAKPKQNGHKPEEGSRVLRLMTASDVPIESTEWLKPDWIPLGMLTLLAGKGGLGKSTLWAAWAADVTLGRMPGKYAGEAKSVLICAGEDDLSRTIVPRLMAAGADLSKVSFVVVDVNGLESGLVLPIDTQALIKAAEAVDAALIVLDPLVTFLDAKLDSHKDHSVRQALKPLSEAANRIGCSIIGLVHLSKGGQGRIEERILGSVAFTNAARSVIGVVRDPEDPQSDLRLAALVKNNLAKDAETALVFRLTSVDVPSDDGQGFAQVAKVEIVDERFIDRSMIDEEPRSAMEREELDEAESWLLHFLSGWPMAQQSKDVLKAGKLEGFGKTALYRARASAGVTVFSTDSFPRKSYWVHPDSPRPPQVHQDDPEDPQFSRVFPGHLESKKTGISQESKTTEVQGNGDPE